MISKKMEDALNAQINAEMYSAYLYLSMAADFEDKNLPGFAHWMYLQAQEEFGHAARLYNYISEQQGKVKLAAIDAPQTEWANPVAVFEAVDKHEQYVTSLINNLVAMAMEEKDFASNIFLQWFVTEQVEEESNASTLLAKLKMVGDHVQGLFMMDRELAQRVGGTAVFPGDGVTGSAGA
jgi:ferritin